MKREPGTKNSIEEITEEDIQSFVGFFTGLCGNARLADVGGPGFLLPLPQKDKVSIQY